MSIYVTIVCNTISITIDLLQIGLLLLVNVSYQNRSNSVVIQHNAWSNK